MQAEKRARGSSDKAARRQDRAVSYLELVPPFLRGLTLSLSLIVAIGPQNAFVLRQGLTRQYALLAALVCALTDSLMISVGVLGVGAWLARSPALTLAGTLAGAAFLLWYGWKSFRSAQHPGTLETAGQAQQSPRTVVATALAFSFLNPHVFLDTIVLIGGASAGLGSSGRMGFLGGTILASWIWFFGLALAGRQLAPIMKNPRAWQVLDLIIGVIMWVIAAGLVWGAVQGK